MDSGNSSCSRTRSGLVRRKGIFAPSKGSCSRTRSGLVRVKNFMHSRDGSCSRTRSGLVRIKSFVDSSDSSCPATQSDLVRGSPHIVEDLIKDEAVLKGSPDGLMKEDMPVTVRTRNGLLRRSPAAKAVTKDEPAIKGLPDGCLDGEMPSRTRSGLVRRRPTVKALSKDGPVISGLPDAWQEEDMSAGTQRGLVRGSPAIKTLSKDQPDIKGLADGWLKEDTPLRTRSGLVRGSLVAKTLSKDERGIEGLPDGWRKECRPRKSGSFQDPFYIDPVSGYEFRSLKDVHRYLETGDINQCAMKPKKGTIYDVRTEESQTHTSTSLQRTRPHTADKGIQCEILTSEGIMMPWEELATPYSGNDTENTVSPESESLKAIEETLEHTGVQSLSPQRGTRQTESLKRKEQNVEVKPKKHKTSAAGIPVRVSPRLAAQNVQQEVSIEPEDQPISVNPINRVQDTENTVSPESESLKAIEETLEHTGVQSLSPQRGTRQTESLKRKEQNVEVKPKKHKTSAAGIPVRVSPRLAAQNVQQEVSIEPEDQPISVNPINRVQAIEENSNDQSQMSQSSTLNQIHGNLESTFDQSQLSQSDTGTGMEVMQESTTDHSQPSQVDTVNHIQTNQGKTANQVESTLANIVIPIQGMQECTTDPLSQPDIVNHIQTGQGYTANQLQSTLAGTMIQAHPFQEYTPDYSQPNKDDIVNQIQGNQESTCDQFHFSQVDTVTQMQIIQENMTTQPQLSQADTVGQIHIDLESTIDYSQPSKADNINQLQTNRENTADQLHFSQADCVPQIQIIQGNMFKHPQLRQADTMDRIHINLEDNTNHLQPNYAENSLLQTGFSWAPEQNGGATGTDFWKNVENQDSSVPMPVDGPTVASFPANVRFQNAAGAEPPLPAQSVTHETDSDQSGLAFQSLFGNAWSDPCIEFAFKTLTGDIPVLDDTTAVTDYFPEQQDLNKDPAPSCSASVFDNTRNHTQVDVNLPAPMPSDKLYNGSWFPPQ